jgi:beta-lactam-binding protein with PASTA domain
MAAHSLRGRHGAKVAAAAAAAVASLWRIAGSSNLYQVVVPAVVEDDVNSAYWDLRDASFAVAIEEPLSFDGYVTRQTPAPRSEVRRGSIVSLELSDRNLRGLLPPGGERVMPSLIGDRLDVATRRLTTIESRWSSRGPDLVRQAAEEVTNEPEGVFFS